mmetsp:Transcript_3183/g.12559  ORF Transcript_3183/g.12559 Transcript_3183/m.12559 type:complete len:214 (+) Transcript_3183:536-1177(+)
MSSRARAVRRTRRRGRTTARGATWRAPNPKPPVAGRRLGCHPGLEPSRRAPASSHRRARGPGSESGAEGTRMSTASPRRSSSARIGRRTRSGRRWKRLWRTGGWDRSRSSLCRGAPCAPPRWRRIRTISTASSCSARGSKKSRNASTTWRTVWRSLARPRARSDTPRARFPSARPRRTRRLRRMAGERGKSSAPIAAAAGRARSRRARTTGRR